MSGNGTPHRDQSHGLHWERDWAGERQRVHDALRKLEDLIRSSTRFVGGDGGQERFVAFGQWVGEPEETATRRGQHGVYGTAAGIEVMSRASLRDTDMETIDGAWSYLNSRLSGPKRASQFYIVLRQAMVLRALSALDQTLKQRSPDVRVNVDEVSALAEDLLVELKRSIYRDDDGPAVRIWVNWPTAGQERTEVAGYRFASSSRDAPSFAITWAFHQAAVLNAITAGFRTDLLRQPEDFLVEDHVGTLLRWCNHILEDGTLDPVAVRVAMFAGWALLGLSNGQSGNEDEQDVLAAMFDSVDVVDREKLARGLKGAVRSALKDPALQTDLHLPFLYRLPEAGETGAGEKEDRYRQEHLVVPTVPIMLSLVARLGGRLRFDGHYLNLLSAVCGCLLANRPTVVPAQPTSANGTVNFSYLRTALREVEASLHGLAGESFKERLRQRLSLRQRVAAVAANKWGWLWISAGASAILGSFLTLLLVLFGVP
jgi:hypothetical protein